MNIQSRILFSLSILVLLVCNLQFSNGAVMSIDVGSEWLKIGIVSPGVPMEIVLNKESKRKTPVAISFRNGERLIGEDAINVGVRFPSNSYSYFLDLLAKKIDNPIVKHFQKRFPYYNLITDPERGTVSFQHDSETIYSPEELLGMLISKCKDYAEDFTKQPVKEAVITVPPFFNQAERKAVLNAAELVDLKVLQLMNTNTACALNYGIFRRKDFNETAQHILLFDMGASSTTATVVSYSVAKTKEKGYAETNPQLTILGVGYHRTLGGLEMQIRLRDFLAKAFNEMKKTKTDIFTNPRALAKLLKESGRLKNVLSANSGHYAQVEGLLDDKDFRLPVSREQFEELNQDLFDLVKLPVQQALDASALTMDLIDQVILVGAGTRVPKVQEKLTQYVKRELGKSLNTDESAAMGAVYKAADLSTGFKVKKFITKDAVLFPIMVDFEREIESDGGAKTLKIVRRTLFSHMNPYPQKKIMTFNKHVGDFNFYVSYGDLSFLPAQESKTFANLNITKVELKGVADALEKNKEGTESKGVKAHFIMDDNGLLGLSFVESVFEKNTTEADSAAGEDTLSRIGSAFSQLFSGNNEQPPKADDNESQSNESESKENIGEKSQQEEVKVNDTKSQVNDTKSQQEDVKANATDTAPKKPKLVTIKETLDMVSNTLDIMPLEGDKFKDSFEKLKKLNEIDKQRDLLEKARNALEGYVLDLQHKIYTPEYEQASKEEEREKIIKVCSEISDWLYEDGADAAREIYEEKFKSIKLMTKDLTDRVREIKERPDAMSALDQRLNISIGFLESSKGIPEDQQVFTEVELNTLEKLVKETLEWRKKKLDEQENTPLSEPPVITLRMIAEKIDSLDREVKYMINKARVNKLKKEKEEGAKKAEKEKEQEKNKTTESKDKDGDENKKKESDSQEETLNEKVEESEEKLNESNSKESGESAKVEPSETEKEKETHTEL